jgi:hypothetical protein
VVAVIIIVVDARDHRRKSEGEKGELEFFFNKKKRRQILTHEILIWHTLECSLLFFFVLCSAHHKYIVNLNIKKKLRSRNDDVVDNKDVRSEVQKESETCG